MAASEKSGNRKKPGPPPMDPAQRRYGLPLYLRPAQRAKVEADAKRAGLPLQDWIRKRLGVGR